MYGLLFLFTFFTSSKKPDFIVNILCVFMRIYVYSVLLKRRSNFKKNENHFSRKKDGKENRFKYIKTNSTAGRITGNHKSVFENLSRSTKPTAGDNGGQVLVRVVTYTVFFQVPSFIFAESFTFYY